VFDWRVYRAALVPLVLVLLVSAFSLTDLPAPRTSTLAPDAFDGTGAFNELGADDYITKPFSMREFRSRVKAVLRRSEMSRSEEPAPDEEPLEVGELKIDFAKRTVRLRGELVPTTFVEFEVLSALATSPGRVFTRDMLLARIWGDSAYRDPRTIDVHIRHLREKVEADSKDPDYLFTVRGVGYRFRDSER